MSVLDGETKRSQYYRSVNELRKNDGFSLAEAFRRVARHNGVSEGAISQGYYAFMKDHGMTSPARPANGPVGASFDDFAMGIVEYIEQAKLAIDEEINQAGKELEAAKKLFTQLKSERTQKLRMIQGITKTKGFGNLNALVNPDSELDTLSVM